MWFIAWLPQVIPASCVCAKGTAIEDTVFRLRLSAILLLASATLVAAQSTPTAPIDIKVDPSGWYTYRSRLSRARASQPYSLPDVSRTRLYLEAMERILPKVQLYVIDSDKGRVPLHLRVTGK
jgi:hypothetical protein